MHSQVANEQTCRYVLLNDSIQLPDCPGSAGSHPHQEVLIVGHIPRNGGTSSELCNVVEVGGLVLSIQAVSAITWPRNV